MTPKEKAKELVEKFYQLLPLQSEVITNLKDISWEYDNWKQAKQCALIAVDEILQELELWGGDPAYRDWEIKRCEYLTEVKNEIEKL